MSVTLTLLLGGPTDHLKLSCSASIRHVHSEYSPTRLAVLRLVIIEQGVHRKLTNLHSQTGNACIHIKVKRFSLTLSQTAQNGVPKDANKAHSAD